MYRSFACRIGLIDMPTSNSSYATVVLRNAHACRIAHFLGNKYGNDSSSYCCGCSNRKLLVVLTACLRCHGCRHFHRFVCLMSLKPIQTIPPTVRTARCTGNQIQINRLIAHTPMNDFRPMRGNSSETKL